MEGESSLKYDKTSTRKRTRVEGENADTNSAKRKIQNNNVVLGLPDTDGKESSKCIAKQGEQGWYTDIEIFQKPLTPSDLGARNRFCIPKKNALQEFPLVNHEENKERVDVIQMEFLDGRSSKKLLKFEYCYQKTSKIFVLSTGWKNFVKNKGLRKDDIVIFWKRYDIVDFNTEPKISFIIEVVRHCMKDDTRIKEAKGKKNVSENKGRKKRSNSIRLFGAEI
ncbi:AP2/ERF and B3 domain-containing transcription factor At1g51120-like [Papaver somniferum]|uniref:AP2/ERF and B3 domain-containing transcription factor At1g51120-like n=1 Tax=Papaver somniferum TaxID=3469 RepID=UPI000E70466C|nr:AP2/ERF and B3 domain-containing transcription factor At1g51120-like [Papaver somniferum]